MFKLKKATICKKKRANSSFDSSNVTLKLPQGHVYPSTVFYYEFKKKMREICKSFHFFKFTFYNF